MTQRYLGWQTTTKSGRRKPLRPILQPEAAYPLFHTLCRGRASFVNRGDEAVDCDLLRIDFRASKDEEYRFFPVRLGPGAREAHAAPRNNKWDVKGGGLLTFVDELFDLWYIAPPSRG